MCGERRENVTQPTPVTLTKDRLAKLYLYIANLAVEKGTVVLRFPFGIDSSAETFARHIIGGLNDED